MPPNKGPSSARIGETPAQKILRAVDQHGELERHRLAVIAGVPERKLARVLASLLAAGSLTEVDGVFSSGTCDYPLARVEQVLDDAEDAVVDPVSRPRRDSSHDHLREARWKTLEEHGPVAVPADGWGQRAKVIRRAGPYGSSPARLQIEVDLDTDAEIVARKIRALQREHGVSKLPKIDDARRQAVLLPFVEEHGTGVAAFDLWNRMNPEMSYSGRRSFRAAAKRAIEGRGSVAKEVWNFAGRPEVEEVAPGEFKITPAWGA